MRLERPVRGHVDAVLVAFDLDSDIAQRMQRGAHVARFRPLEPHFAAGDRRRAGIGARLDPVGHHPVGRAVQLADPVDRQFGRADPFDLRAHRGEQIAQIDDLGLARGVDQPAGALAQHRRHQCILGRADRHDGEVEFAAGQPAVGRAGFHIALRQFDMRAEGFEHLEMQVDRAVADRAATGQRHGRLAGARQQRTEHEDRSAHLAHQIVGRDRTGDAHRLERDIAAELLGPLPGDRMADAELRHQVLEAVDIRQPRQVAQRQRLFGQQRAGYQRERGVLGARNGDGPRQAVAAANDQFVHGTVLYPRASCWQASR